LFVDFSGAFDRMSWPRLFSLLRDLQIPPHIYNLLRSYFEDREVQIRIPECIARKKINRGCSQGSILGPILWNTYLENLLGLLDNEQSITDFAAYADDLCILISGNSRKELKIKANTTVRTIHNWCQRYKMTMSPTKTLAIVFGKTLKRKPIIKLGTNTLPVKEDTKYLGIILDQKLNFSKHLNVSLEKARAQFNKILTLTNRKYNIHPRKFKVYYNAIFLSIATYTIQIFADEYKKVRNRRKALTVQRAVFRRIYKAVFRDVLNNTSGKLADSH
jgi:hypothetical protein